MVVADQLLAEQSNYERAVNILGGPRIGPNTIDLIQCTGRAEHHTITHKGITTRSTKQQIRPNLRRAVLARDDGFVIDGCTNTHRLEVHHITPLSQGGTHQADNLAALCWYHHHVAVHRNGLQLDPRSPSRRRRLIRPQSVRRRRPPPQLRPLLSETG